MTEPARWHPDEQLVAAVLAAGSGRYEMTALSLPDRCWVVAGLGQAGLTADEIADRLSCSIRLVRTVRGEPLTAACHALLHESSIFADELRLARNEAMRLAVELATVAAECSRLRNQVVRLSTPPGARFPMCSAGLHPMSPTNIYTHGKTGRIFCRGCHALRQARYRSKSKDSVCV